MLKKMILAAMCMFAFLASVSFADAVVGPGSFYSFGSITLNENGVPYWDQKSKDGAQKNIGFQLQNLGLSPDFYAVGGSSAPSSFYFTQNGVNDSAVMLIEIAANSGINEFGWYATGNTSTLHPIFAGSDSPITSATFDPAASYGFYLKSGSYTFFTQSGNNTGGESPYQHFALFSSNQTPGSEVYYLGMEDLPASARGIECLGDYNDMLVKITTNPIPEPSTYLLLGSALVGLGFFRRRRKM